jgi:large subunit ribosomal protein L6
MSRIGKLPVTIPNNIKVELDKGTINFNLGKISKTYKINHRIIVKIVEGKILLAAADNFTSEASMFLGMDRSNIKNIILGLQNGFKNTLEINGVGYKASVDKSTLILTLGYSHEIFYVLPEGISASFEKPNLITISGDNNTLVGQVCAEIISFKKPEPYKGKGVKILGKKIIRKEGKKK